MAARLRPRHQDDVRMKIQAGNLINRLEKHISGEISLENSQIKSIEILLDRSIPKLSAVEVSGPDGGPVEHKVSVDFEVRAADLMAKIRK